MKQLCSIKRVFENSDKNRKSQLVKPLNLDFKQQRKQKPSCSKRQLAPLTNCFTILNFSCQNSVDNYHQTQFSTNPILVNAKNKEEKKSQRQRLLPKLINTMGNDKITIKPIVIKSKLSCFPLNHQPSVSHHKLHPIIENVAPKYSLKSFYSLTQQGGKNNRMKENQDTIAINHNIHNFEYYHCFGVFDGHGEYGTRISEECSHFFSNYFTNIATDSSEVIDLQTKLTKDNYSKIKEAFVSSEECIRNHHIDASFSGTTANVILIIGDMLLCANVGDSRTILVTQSNAIIPLSTDDRPELPEERSRILLAKGQVDRLEGISFGPYRVWKQNEEYPGLAMSRSIGDSIAHQIGVISEPNITQFSFQQLKPKYIICATDGIWDCISNNEAIKITAPFYLSNNPTEAASALAIQAKKTWKALNNNIYDDISVIVLFF